MYLAYETSPTSKGTYFLPAIGGTMSDRPVLRLKGNRITVGDNREVYEGEYADELYEDILAALAGGTQNTFSIPEWVAKKETAKAKAAAAEAKKAAAAEAKKAEQATEAAAEEPPTEATTKTTAKTTAKTTKTTTSGKTATEESGS